MSVKISSPRLSSKHEKWSSWLQFALIILLGAQIYLLLKDFLIPPEINAPLTYSNRPAIAEIVKITGSTLSRSPQSLVWRPIQGNQKIPNKEWLITESHSSANIAFYDGTGLEIGENSLLIFEKKTPESLPQIDVKRGKVQKITNSKSPIQINFGSIQAIIPPETQFTIQTQKDTDGKVDSAQIQVLSGSIEFSNQIRPNEKLLIKEGEQTTLTPHEKSPPVIEPLPPPEQLLEPIIRQKKPGLKKPVSFLDFFYKKLNSILISEAFAQETSTIANEIVLRWTPVPGAKKYRIQISKRSNFKDLLIDSKSNELEYVWSYSPGMENTKGRVFFRVASIDEHGKQGTFSESKIVEIPDSLRNISTQKKIAQPLHQSVHQPVHQPDQIKKYLLHAGVGFGSLAQTSAASDLTRVDVTGPFLRQILQFEYQTKTSLFFKTYFSSSSFEPSQSTAYSQQPKVSSFSVRQEAYLFFPIRLGLLTEWDYRWVKRTRLSIKPGQSISLGPSIQYIGNNNLTQWGCSLSLPLSGALYRAQFGALGQVWFDFFPTKKIVWLNLRMLIEGSYRLWENPNGTKLIQWNMGILPGARF